MLAQGPCRSRKTWDGPSLSNAQGQLVGTEHLLQDSGLPVSGNTAKFHSPGHCQQNSALASGLPSRWEFKSCPQSIAVCSYLNGKTQLWSKYTITLGTHSGRRLSGQAWKGLKTSKFICNNISRSQLLSIDRPDTVLNVYGRIWSLSQPGREKPISCCREEEDQDSHLFGSQNLYSCYAALSYVLGIFPEHVTSLPY